jgi:hypothetical protein
MKTSSVEAEKWGGKFRSSRYPNYRILDFLKIVIISAA